MNSWFVSIELHTLPGDARSHPFAGEKVIAPSEALLEAARSRGMRTAVVAFDRRTYGRGFDHCVDEWLETDTSSPEDVLAAIDKLDGLIAVVTSSVDNFIRVAATVAHLRGLVGSPPHAHSIQRDKSRARQALRETGHSDIRWGVGDAADPALSSPIGYPAVAKPVDGASSWDVAVVTSDLDTRILADRHLARNYGRGVQPRRRLLFEEVLVGPIFSAEGIVVNGEVAMLGYCDRVMSKPPHFVELALRFATEPPDESADNFVSATLQALGYSWGPFHLEFVQTSQGHRMIEHNARLVGAGLQSAIAHVSGVHPAELLLEALLGGRPVVPAINAAVTELRLLPEHDGVLVAHNGLDDAVRVPGCVSAGLYVALGDIVRTDVETNSDRIGFVQAVGCTRAESLTVAREAAQRVVLGVR